MHRTPSLTQTLVAPGSSTIVSNWTEKRRAAQTTTRRMESFPHSVFAPISYEPGYAYPLIVWLHGSDSSELELQQVMPLVSVRNFVGIAPRGTRRTSKNRRVFGWRHTAGEVADACQQVRECLDIARNRFHVHPERIFVAGRCDGGTMALRVGMEHPELFAGAISLGGRVPRGGNAFRRINAARRLPLMLSVSPTAQEFTTQQVMDDLRLLHCGGFSLSLRLYPEGQTLTDTMFADMNVWLMESFCPTVVSAS
ncbi:MAG: alpha/beta hydrolase-fold protein [Bythopirellula sp.]|nr:alpha/beta hydrolase-fold protein [Bythopirellula sp.]